MNRPVLRTAAIMAGLIVLIIIAANLSARLQPTAAGPAERAGVTASQGAFS